jgi:hypothetical protein
VIVGVAQVVVNVAELGESPPGMTQTFAARGLSNHPAKAPFQAAPRETLDMVHFTSGDGGLALELTRYDGAPPGGRAAYALRNGAAFLAASDPEASGRFWREAMRFEERSPGAFAAPAMHPSLALDVIVAPAPGAAAEPTSVDADGCVLVTVLTTGIERELQRLHATGLLLRSTPPWRETVSERELHVAFVEGPSGELVELLEAPR